MSKPDFNEVVEVLCDVINQACGIDDKERTHELDSGALSAYADGIRLLDKLGKVEMVHQAGRRVLAKWIKEPYNE